MVRLLLALLLSGCATIPDSVVISQGEWARVQLNNVLYMDTDRTYRKPPTCKTANEMWTSG
jgi:starvation-inducible outer membrane lipoprotein